MVGTLYIIQNKVNNKVYVGKTYIGIDERIKRHIEDSKKERCSNRALYRAFKKYGLSNFRYGVIGRFEKGLLEEKEKEYIKLYRSNKAGYNMTSGGDGRPYLNLDVHKDEIHRLYTEDKLNLENIARIYGCHSRSIRTFLENSGIETRDITESMTASFGRKVTVVEKNKQFPSCMGAARWVKTEYSSNRSVRSICAGICKSCKSNGHIACEGLHWNYI